MRLPLTTDQQNRLISLIEGENARIKPARGQMEKELKKWRRAFELDDTELKKNVPFPKASHIYLPLLFEETRLAYGRLWGMLWKYRPTIAVRSFKDEDEGMVRMAEQIQRGLDTIFHSEIRIREKLTPVLLEGTLTGMGVVYLPWVRQVRLLPQQQLGETPVGSPTAKRDPDALTPRTVFNGMDVEFVELDNFYWPPEAKTLDAARWVYRSLYYVDDEIWEMAEKGILDAEAVKAVMKSGAGDRDPFLTEQFSIEELNIPPTPMHNLLDWWGWFRMSPGEAPRMLNCIYHPHSRKILEVDYNPYEDQLYPFAIWNFLQRPGRVMGTGAGRLLEPVNRGLNDVTNQRIDAGRIANSKVFKIRKGSGVKPSEKIYPGKRLYLSNPADVVEMNFGDVKQSAYAEESNFIQWADRVMSASAEARGQQSVSRPNASGQLALIGIMQENAAAVADSLNLFMSRIGRLAYSRQKQFGDMGKLLGIENGSPETPSVFIPSIASNTLVFELAAANERINEESQRQVLTSAYQMWTGYYQLLLQFAEVQQDPELMAQISSKASAAMTEFMRRIGHNLSLEGFEKFLVEVNSVRGEPSVPRIGPAPEGGQGRLDQGNDQLRALGPG